KLSSPKALATSNFCRGVDQELFKTQEWPRDAKIELSESSVRPKSARLAYSYPLPFIDGIAREDKIRTPRRARGPGTSTQGIQGEREEFPPWRVRRSGQVHLDGGDCGAARRDREGALEAE